MEKKREDKTIYMKQNKREIKFRVWDKQEQEMLYSDSELIKNFDIFSGWWFEEGKESVDRERMVLMQFTGLLDKNGMEIYQNDIAMVKEREDGSAQIGVVEWDTSEARFFIHVKTCRVNMWYGFENLCIEEDGMFTDKYDIRVIGNIYENPSYLN